MALPAVDLPTAAAPLITAPPAPLTAAPLTETRAAVKVAALNPKPTPGLKKALLVGINYKGSEYELKGCINDTKAMEAHLKQYFPSCKEYRFLNDETAQKPSKKNILDAIQWLIADLKPGEHVFFQYSGHGGTVRDINGDEVSGLDSCIYPFENGKMDTITDDELRTALANKIPAVSKCFVVLDCCHSGTAIDLRYTWQVPEEMALFHKESKAYPNTAGQIVFLSGCHDAQTAADTVGADLKPCGALTWALIDTWKAYGPAIKLKYILWDVHIFLKRRGYDQLPQLSLGNYMDINAVFDMRIA